MDLALGALAAGLMIGLATRKADAHVLRLKLDAVGFGFLIPIFFISSGMRLDLKALGGSSLVPVAAFLAALLLARVPFVLLHLRGSARGTQLARALLGDHTVARRRADHDRGLMTPAEAAPLVAAGMLSVMLFPALGLRLSPASQRSSAADHARSRGNATARRDQ